MTHSTELGTGLQLFGHPFSSYTQKVLIALWADRTPFEYRMLDGEHPDNMAELQRHWPVGQFPLLLDDGEHIRHRRLLPTGQRVTPATEATGIAYSLDVAKHAILPMVTLAFGLVAQYVLIMRASMDCASGPDAGRTRRIV